MKKNKKIISVICLCFLCFLTGCSKKDENVEGANTDTIQYNLYLSAKENGYTDSFDKWNTELSEETILLRIVDKDIQWRYKGGSIWSDVYIYNSSNTELYDEFIDNQELDFEQYYTAVFNYYTYETLYTSETVIVKEGSVYNKTDFTISGYVLVDDIDTIIVNKTMSINFNFEYADYTITLDAIGSDLIDKTIEVSYNSNFTLPEVNKEGYEFIGWYYGSEKVEDSIYKYTSNITLSAKWELIEYIIDYELDGGQTSNLLKYTIETNVTLQDATKTGFDFIGWYTDEEFTNKIESVRNSTGNLTLYARWTLAQYDITYELNDSENNTNNIETYTIETEFTFLPAQKSYYTFKGWNVNGVFYETYTIKNVTGNLLLEAVFEGNSYNINYELSDGILSKENPAIYSLDDGNVLLELPVKEGYISYWSVETYKITINYLNEYLLDVTNSTTITLYCKYVVEREIFTDNDSLGNLLSYTYFGSYPQTVVSDEDIINQLNNITNLNDKGYYELAGFEYAKLEANPFSKVYEYSSGEVIVKGNSYYFKVEPIKWRVLNKNGHIQYVSEFLLDISSFYGSYTEKEVDGTTIYANNYEHSDVRSFLNNEFYNSAFSTIQQNLIKTSEVDNSAATTLSSTNPYACNNTNDKVYLLSIQDVMDEDFGFSSDSPVPNRQTLITDYSMSQYTGVSNSYGNWLLRSPDNSGSRYYYNVSLQGYYFKSDSSSTVNYCIRPVIQFNN